MAGEGRLVPKRSIKVSESPVQAAVMTNLNLFTLPTFLTKTIGFLIEFHHCLLRWTQKNEALSIVGTFHIHWFCWFYCGLFSEMFKFINKSKHTSRQRYRHWSGNKWFLQTSSFYPATAPKRIFPLAPLSLRECDPLAYKSVASWLSEATIARMMLHIGTLHMRARTHTHFHTHAHIHIYPTQQSQCSVCWYFLLYFSNFLDFI